jgi:Leucine-rich repeat (LRR) protein
MSELDKQKKFNSLEDALKTKDKVYFLSLSNKSLKSIPLSVFELKNLQFLDLRNNQISSIPNEILQLKNLQFLVMANNELQIIPAFLNQMLQLKSLDISENRLMSLPNGLNALKNLEELNIENNRFQKIPEEVCKIGSLQILKIWGNPVNEAPKGLCSISKLEELFIDTELLLKIIDTGGPQDSKITIKQCVKDEAGNIIEGGENEVYQSQMGTLQKLKKLHLKKNLTTTAQQKTIQNAFKTVKIFYY